MLEPFDSIIVLFIMVVIFSLLLWLALIEKIKEVPEKRIIFKYIRQGTITSPTITVTTFDDKRSTLCYNSSMNINRFILPETIYEKLQCIIISNKQHYASPDNIYRNIIVNGYSIHFGTSNEIASKELLAFLELIDKEFK